MNTLFPARRTVNGWLLLCVLLQALPGYAQTGASRKLIANNTISLFYGRNNGTYVETVKTGRIETLDKSTTYGLSYSKDLYFTFLPRQMYLTTGLRLQVTAAGVRVRTGIPGFDTISPYNRLDLEYTQVGIPLYVGRTFTFGGGSRAHVNLFSGVTAGLSQISFYGSNLGGSGTDVFYGETLSSSSNDSYFGHTQDYPFYAAFDLGFRGTPANFPNLTIGATASLDLTPTPSFELYGHFANETRQLRENFHYRFSRKYIHLMASLNYTFSRRWKRALTDGF